MKYFLTSILILLSFSISLTSYASAGCTHSKSLYESGKYERAFKIASTYAKYGDACAEYYLGLMYLGGKGVTADGQKGDKYLLSAAKKGYQPAIDYIASIAP